MKSVLFIDLDGTYIGFNSQGQYILDSSYQGLQASKRNGNINVICTGRSLFEINSVGEKIHHGFDAIIGAAGGYIEYNGQVIQHSYFNDDDLNEIRNFFEENHVMYYLECNQGLYWNDAFKKMIYEQNLPWGELYKDLDECNDHVNKISFNCTKEALEAINEHYKGRYCIVNTSYARGYGGEISTLGISKKTAIETLLKHLNINEYTTYGFGDSMNDIEMFNAVDHSIAMGNARDGLKELAEFVTKDLDDDGFLYALQHYHLIQEDQ